MPVQGRALTQVKECAFLVRIRAPLGVLGKFRKAGGGAANTPQIWVKANIDRCRS
jgi:hypothetical protein